MLNIDLRAFQRRDHEGVYVSFISGDNASEDAGRGIGLWKDNRPCRTSAINVDGRGKGNKEVLVERGLRAMGDE